MKIAVILPHLKLFGGVKRYLELGNIFVDMGHQFIVYVPKKKDITWFNFKGDICSLSTLKTETLDAIFTSEEVFLNDLCAANSRNKIFYVISKNKALKRIVKKDGVTFFANSTTTYKRIIKKTGVKPFKAFGGVSVGNVSAISNKKTGEEITVLIYGRQSNNNIKGTDIVVKACELLFKKGFKIKMLLFDSPVDENAKKQIDGFKTEVPYEFIVNHPVEKNNELFSKADMFVSAEKKGGWSNTCAEAMTYGIPVIATKIGTEDFLFNNKTGLVIQRNKYSIAKAIKKLIASKEQREKFKKNGFSEIRKFDWKILAEKIIVFISERD